MGMEAILEAIENPSKEIQLNLSMSETSLGSMILVNFRISHNGTLLDGPISAPRNQPYHFTGKERIPYHRIWDELCKISPPNPLTYLGPSLKTDFKRNLPNALHLIASWLRSFEECKSYITKNPYLKIESIGNNPYNEEVLDALKKELDIYDVLYQGYKLEDAEVF